MFENHWCSSGVFCSTVSIVNFEHVIAGWEDLNNTKPILRFCRNRLKVKQNC